MQHAAESMITDAAYVTRQDIVNFPFPTKLWICVHLDFCDFLRWNRDGTVILLDLIALEDYLNSTRSIFKIKNRSIFLDHLEEFKFERLNATPEAEEDLLLQYQNENFQRHRLDLLAKIRRHTYQLLGEIECVSNAAAADAAAATAQQAQSRVIERMLGDLCFMSHGGLSHIQKSRLHFQIILNFQNETRILQEKLMASDEHAAAQAQQRRFKPNEIAARASSGGGSGIAAVQQQQQQQEEEQVIELPVELFENPHDSVLHLGEDFRPEYAGYYGNCSKEQIMHFFGDYLPMYEDGSMEVKKIVAEVGSTNQSMQLSDLEQTREQIMQGSNEEELNIIASSTPIQQSKSMPTLNLSSTLEPIFKTDEDDTGHSYIVSNVLNMDSEADISMDEFITFKANHDNVGDVDGEGLKAETPSGASKDFPQMPSAVKMEINDEDDGSENEANFRNFFSQYRASLNLLYDRH